MRRRPLIALTCGLLLAGCSGRDPVLAAMDADPDWCPSGWPEVEDTFLMLECRQLQQCAGRDDITSIQACVDGSIPKTLGPPSCVNPCDTRKCMDWFRTEIDACHDEVPPSVCTTMFNCAQ